jgi:hypothetical protein
MFRTFVIASMLIVSTSAFAADTPDPNASGPAALPSGSNAANPPSSPTSGAADETVGKSEKKHRDFSRRRE